MHLAHHPTLDVDCLYDHVHLYKQAVPIFAKTLKDATLNCNPAPPPFPLPRLPRNTTTSAARTPQPRPPQPLYHHPRQVTGRPLPLLPPELTIAPTERLTDRQSYAQTARGTANPPATSQLKDIQHMLSLICSHLMEP